MANIGYDAKSAFLNFSGQGNYTRTLIKTISSLYEDNDYYLYTPPYDVNLKHDFRNRNNVYTRTLDYLDPENHYSMAELQEKDLRKDSIDLFHGLSTYLPDSTSSVRTVVTLHDVIFMRYPEYYSEHEKRTLETLFRASCLNADKIIAASRQTADDAIRFLDADPSRIEVVYQGCDSIFHTRPDMETIRSVAKKYRLPQKYILNMGKLEPRKNILNVIKAFKGIPEEYHLVIAGRHTPYADTIRLAAEESGMGNRIHILTGMDYSDLPSIYAGADMLTYISDFEGFGLPVLEALSIGIPVLTSDISSMPEVGGNAVIKVNPHDINEIHAYMQLILNSPTSRESMVGRGFIQAEHFKEENSVKTIYEIYKSLLK